MIQTIVRDETFLSQVSQDATQNDLYLAQDLLDTLAAHKDHCVGLAANMIGHHKRAIIIDLGFMPLVLFNPKIIKKTGIYRTEESCLSLTGSRSTKRYQEITVSYLDKQWQEQTITLKDFPAQICQHELDHLEGILI